MEKGSLRLGIKMKIDNRLEEIPDEFKKLAEQFFLVTDPQSKGSNFWPFP